jgi:predicted nucleotide-binding protein (sugar kinase/HSP70/actin superfamily)
MKGGFPLMGDSYFGFGKTMEGFGHEVVIPKASSKKTIRLGVKHAPEYACWPLKVSLGSLIECLDMGAELITTLGGSGPCRAGWYGEIQRKIINEELGYNLEHFYPAYNLDVLYKMAALGGKSKFQAWKAIRLGWSFQKATEHFEGQTLKNRAREENPGEHTKVYKEIKEWMWEAHSLKELKTVKRRAQSAMDDIPLRKDAKPMKVGVVGEIYVVLDPFANLEVEKKMGDMGVEVHRSIWLTHWIWREVVMGHWGLTSRIAKRELHKNAAPYLHEPVGGDGIESIANVRVYKEKGYDGVIEIGPFTCIPEIVAKSILPAMSRDLDIPVLTFNVDEHTGEAGVSTRLEAFSDLLSQRRDGIPLPSRRMSALVEEVGE